MRGLFGTLMLLSVSVGVATAAEPRPMEIADLFRFVRISDPQISPDGTRLVYPTTQVDLASNKTRTNLYLASIREPSKPKALTTSAKSDRHPRWSPDGRFILFESNRSGSNQIWIIPVDGGEARQLTHVSTGASNAIWSPDGKRIAFVSAVFPEFSHKPFAESNALNQKKLDEIAQSPVQARVFTKLFFRHWDEYVEDKRQHLFVLDLVERDGELVPQGDPRDVTPGDRDAYPTSMTFSVGDDFTFSPDGSHLIFTAVPERNEAWSTNYDLCRVPVVGGNIETLTRDNPAADGAPKFSPDGGKLAYRAQRRAGFEADRWEIMIVDVDPSGKFLGQPKSATVTPTSTFDASPESFVWLNNGAIAFVADWKGSVPLFALAIAGPNLEPKILIDHGMNGNLSVSKAGRLAFTHAAMTAPPEACVEVPSEPGHNGFAFRNVSQANNELLRKLHLPRPESVTVPVEGANMQMWLLKPPGFQPNQKWPVVYLVHGGPQGAWEDGWSFRWNPELWAAQGYIVALPNPRGSTGFGQKFVDAISRDWGGKCFDDLMKGVDYLETLPYVDKDRIAAAGASFGGYMVNYFAVKTGRFKCLISHCGVWNFDSMYGYTEELWFDEWEHGLPWGPDRHSYEKHSPHRHAANLAKFKTPMLVIHNDLDFRVPIGEGLQLFTTLQRLGVPSRMVNFPDEGHWVLKPRNSERWHQECFAWLKKYVPPGPQNLAPMPRR